jgi:hypothetical protein
MPLIKGLRSTTYTKAFILNAIATALIALVAVEMKGILTSQSLQLDPIVQGLITFIATFTTAILVYFLLYLIFGFGGGMIASGASIFKK